MRTLSCEWPLYLTAAAFVLLPGCEVLDYCLGTDYATLSGLLEQVRVAFGITTIIWIVYLVACLVARPLRDVSAEKPWKPRDDFHIEIKNDEDQAKPTSQNLPK